MLPLILTLLLAFFLRMAGLEWDQGFHLHPDERMLIIVADRIHFFNELNPHFFNYGTLPIYLLKGTGQLLDGIFGTSFANYQGLLYIGRALSLFADIGVVVLVYKITQLLIRHSGNPPAGGASRIHRSWASQDDAVPLFAMFFYALAFFPIQNTHFFVVDVFMNFFITAALYKLLRYIEKPTITRLTLISIFTAAAIATKFTAVLFILPICVGLVMPHFIKYRHLELKKLSIHIPFLILFGCLTALFHFIFMPYAYLEFAKFFSDVSLQTKMNSDPYIFPYTLQYVGTTPYLYYLKNIFFWGLGPIISILSIISVSGIWYLVSGGKIQDTRYKILIVVIFYLTYFLIIGHSAVKFMRYMLPLYPFLAICAGYGASTLRKWVLRRHGKQYPVGQYLITVLIVATLFWTFSFTSIYRKPHTRIQATNWILEHIPPGSHIAVEHWDDHLPLTGGERYVVQELTLYDRPDNELKWDRIHEVLATTDYIIIASNRLYVPLQKLADCSKYEACYPVTAQYYKNLFDGTLGFKKVAEFSSYPRFGRRGEYIYLNDDGADESFTVYDHPKIMIFKKI